MGVALDSPGWSLPVGVRQLVAAADPPVLDRITLALESAGLPAAVSATCQGDVEEAVAEAGEGDAVLVLGCDVAKPARMAELRRLHRRVRGARIVLISPSTDATGVRRALEAGADGVVFEYELEATLAASIIAVAAGQAAVPRRLRGGLQKPAFSHRERQVLAHVTAGLSNSEIADALFLSQSTVKSHLSSAFAKLGVRSRKEAAALILDPEHGLGADLLPAGLRETESP